MSNPRQVTSAAMIDCFYFRKSCQMFDLASAVKLAVALTLVHLAHSSMSFHDDSLANILTEIAHCSLLILFKVLASLIGPQIAHSVRNALPIWKVEIEQKLRSNLNRTNTEFGAWTLNRLWNNRNKYGVEIWLKWQCYLWFHLPYPTLPYPTLPYPTLPYPTLPYPTLPYPTIPYHTLPYPTLPYPTIYVCMYYTCCVSSLFSFILEDMHKYMHIHDSDIFAVSVYMNSLILPLSVFSFFCLALSRNKVYIEKFKKFWPPQEKVEMTPLNSPDDRVLSDTRAPHRRYNVARGERSWIGCVSRSAASEVHCGSMAAETLSNLGTPKISLACSRVQDKKISIWPVEDTVTMIDSACDEGVHERQQGLLR